MKFLLGLLFFLTITSVSAQEIPGLTEVSGFVCKDQASAETIGEAYQKGGQEVAGQTAQALAQEGKCGTLKETMWAIGRKVKIFSYKAQVINLMEFDINGTKVYGLQDKGELLV